MAPPETRAKSDPKDHQSVDELKNAMQRMHDDQQEMKEQVAQLSAAMQQLLTQHKSAAPPAPPADLSVKTDTENTSGTNKNKDNAPERFRADEVGYFNGSGDPHVYAARLREISLLRGARYVLNNLSVLLTDRAFNWFMYEITDGHRLLLTNQQIVQPFCEALIDRFGKQQSQLLEELRAKRYTRQDAANQLDATKYVSEILAITSQLKWTIPQGLSIAREQFDLAMALQLPPNPAQVNKFIKHIQLQQPHWHRMYATFGRSSKPPERPPDQPRRHPPIKIS